MAELSLVILPSDDCHLTSELISLMIRSTLAQIKAWCHQATSHYLCHCWPTSMSSYGIIRPQWLNTWSAANFCENLSPISNDVIWTTKVMQNHWNTRTLGRKYMYLNSTWPGNVVCRHRSINACQVMSCYGTKPLLEPIFTYHHWSSVSLTKTNINLWNDWIGLDFFNDDTCPSGHVSRPSLKDKFVKLLPHLPGAK